MGQGPPGIMSFGKSKARIHMEPDTGVTFHDVAGIDEAVEELEGMSRVSFGRPRSIGDWVGRIPKGVLLVGPPGTGKTLLARATAGEAGVPFFSLSGSEFVEMFVGVGAARVRDLLPAGRRQGARASSSSTSWTRSGSRAHQRHHGRPRRAGADAQPAPGGMDGFDARAERDHHRARPTDPRFSTRRSCGRDASTARCWSTGRTSAAAEEILQIHARNVKLAPDVDLRTVAARTSGFAGADLANVVNEAALLAARRNKSAVGRAELEEAVDRVVAGLEKRSRRINEREKGIVAFHESGHALVSWMLPHADRVSKVSIIPRGLGALGYTLQLPSRIAIC